MPLRLRYPIVHCCYHKTGTVWFRRVFRNLANRYDLTFDSVRHGGSDGVELDPYHATSDLFFDPHSRLEFPPDVQFRGSHMIRDPRDIVISGYRYHLWTKEKWVHQPAVRWGGKTYQQYLNSLSEEEGLEAEMRRLAGSQFRRMQSWDYSDERFLELKYEDMIGNELVMWRQIFSHYGWPEDDIDKAARFADRFSFKNITKRDPGAKTSESHLRSGAPRQWQREYSDHMLGLARELLTPVLMATGYEDSPDW